MKIRAFKLTTGEELIAKIVGETPTFFNITNPLVVRMTLGKDNNIQVNFLPWTIIAEDEILLYQVGIVADYEVPEDVKNSYIQNTTGIQVVSAPPTQILRG
jgi:hypothetical protein